jgi:hypothetical protein
MGRPELAIPDGSISFRVENPKLVKEETAMLNRIILPAAVAALAALLMPSQVGAYGAAHVGYTHVGPTGVYHAGATEVRGPGGAYGEVNREGYGGAAYGGAYRAGYGGAAYGGYHYDTRYYGGAAVGGVNYGYVR